MDLRNETVTFFVSNSSLVKSASVPQCGKNLTSFMHKTFKNVPSITVLAFDVII
jgi:hypothetical protein